MRRYICVSPHRYIKTLETLETKCKIVQTSGTLASGTMIHFIDELDASRRHTFLIVTRKDKMTDCFNTGRFFGWKGRSDRKWSCQRSLPQTHYPELPYRLRKPAVTGVIDARVFTDEMRVTGKPVTVIPLALGQCACLSHSKNSLSNLLSYSPSGGEHWFARSFVLLLVVESKLFGWTSWNNTFLLWASLLISCQTFWKTLIEMFSWRRIIKITPRANSLQKQIMLFFSFYIHLRDILVKFGAVDVWSSCSTWRGMSRNINDLCPGLNQGLLPLHYLHFWITQIQPAEASISASPF